jgi:hypothetical protein
MTPLTQEFVDNCPLEGDFRMRGMDMTRIEVFVDAAFAFAVTMLVISFDSIPTSFPEMVVAIKGVPAFIMAVAQLVWIWHAHNIWSKRYGLDTAYTVFLSSALLIVVLIYIYPMRIMLQGMFSWFTGGYLPSEFELDSMQELSAMFVFLGIGFVSLSMVFILMNRYAASLKDELLLNAFELHETRGLQIIWLGAAVIGLISILLALTLPASWVPFSGFAYMLLAGWMPWIDIQRFKARPNQDEAGQVQYADKPRS